MPYEVRKNGDNYDVVNSETDEIKATHVPPDAEEKAKRQVDLLNEIENDPRWDADDE